MNSVDYRQYISEIRDFPKQGILFRDICPLMTNPQVWNSLMGEFSQLCDEVNPDMIAGIDARGFIVGSALSTFTNIAFLPIRKQGKLPGKTIGIDYELEYGSDRLEVQKESLINGIRILIIDDLLATGGTAKAAGDLITESKANLVGYGFVVELSDLKGREKLNYNGPIKSIVTY